MSSSKAAALVPKGFKPFRIGLIQLATGANKGANLASAARRVAEAASVGKAQVVVLPECFNSPYGTQYFDQYAERLSPEAESYAALSKMARDNKVWLIGGSIPERSKDGEKLFNTSLSFDDAGELVAVHRKVHLFDIDVPGKIRFQESDSLSAGDSLTTLSTPWGALGVGICYDVRFPEMAQIAARRDDVCAMIYPGAFNLTTGPLHWELLGRARAVDNQIYVALCSPAREMTASYNAFGHSTVVDPNGQVVVQAGVDEEIVYADLDPHKIGDTRLGIPVTTQRRFDVYTATQAAGAEAAS